MIGTKRFLTVILMSISLWSVTTSVDGSRPSCPEAAVLDLTEENPGNVFPEKSVWNESGRRFGCPCEFEKCVQICCPAKDVIEVEGCIKNEEDLYWVSYDVPDNRDVYFFTDNPCLTNHSLIEKYHEKWQDWLVHRNNVRMNNLTSYCYVRRYQAIINFVGVCIDGEGYGLLLWSLVSISISMVFVLATFIVYSVTLELKSLQGSIFRCYLASYICCMLLFTLFLLRDIIIIERSNRTNAYLTYVTVFGLSYFGVASMMWVNVMSFDIWKTFRKFRSSREINMKDRQQKKFVRYSIYAWGGPFVFTSFLHLEDYRYLSLSFWLYFLVVWILGIGICNTCMYVSTALTIKRRKKETGHIIAGANRHHQENEQWFNLYLKLFIVMGGPLILWAVGIYLQNKIFWRIIYVVEALQGISVFFIFVWKDDVKRLFRQRFDEALCTLASFFRSVPTPALETQII